MRESVPASHPQTTPNADATRAAEAVDELLTTGPYLLIGQNNRRTGWAATLTEAHQAVATGRAATWAALPRLGVTALDLDMPPGLAALVADEVASWCRLWNLWHVTRESGTAGHLHLWVYSAERTEHVEHLVDRLRHDLHLSGSQLDVRSATYMRPLSAPHRSGNPAPADRLTPEHLADLLARLDGRELTPRPTRRRHRTSTPRRPALRSGRHGAQPVALDDAQMTGDRSRDEWTLTVAAYNAGMSEADAWQQVADLDGHSAERGRRWWQTQMWDRIEPPTTPAHPEGQQLTDAAARSLPAILARLTVLPRMHQSAAKSLDAVLFVLGERVAEGDEPTPVSTRDLEGATGLASNTVCDALARAEAAQIIVRHIGGRPEAAHAWTWGPAMQEAPRVSGTPCLTPAAAGWLHTLPRGSATALALHHSAQPVPAPLAPALAAILTVVAAAASTPYVEAPAWPRIRSERDTWHQAIRASRAAHQAQWEADRAAACRRQRAHALAWKRAQVARVHAEHLARTQARRQHQPTLPRLDCLPGSPRGRVMWTARATAQAQPAHSARSDHRPAPNPAHPSHPLAHSGDAWTAPGTAPWTASPQTHPAKNATTDPQPPHHRS